MTKKTIYKTYRKAETRTKHYDNLLLKRDAKRVKHIAVVDKNKEQNNRGVYEIKIYNKLGELKWIYIGSSVNIHTRFRQHKKELLDKYKLPSDYLLELHILENLPAKKESGSVWDRSGWLLVRESMHWATAYLETPTLILNKAPFLLLSNRNFLGFKKSGTKTI